MDSKEIKINASEVHKRVSNGFTYISDETQYGVREDWRFPEDVDNLRGDCDDFAIACRTLLRERGVETRLIVCQTETGIWHLVCNAGDLILDNRQTRVKTIKELTRSGYQWKYVSGTSPGDDWHVIDRVR